MPKLIIDNKEVVVPEGTNVLEAAKSVGILIPHFCYHEALGSVGACRLCAVKCLDGPVKGLQMSCMIEARDGMVVSTTDPEAMRMRTLVIEWLMTNHPHDCPVCDEGGECLLQEMTIAGEHSIRRYRGKKRTFKDQNLGPYIHHEMNRCIQCYRCSRFYQEFAGGNDFGPLGSANHIYFGRFEDGAFESSFSGNILDICPTGAFTDKTARYQARWWDYEIASSVCPVCSLGCSIYPVARYRELLKIMARFNDKVNGFFICDQGRFSQDIVNGPQRIRASFFNGREVTLQDAIQILAQHLSDMMESGKGESIGFLSSSRATLETQLLMKRLANAMDTPWISYFSDSKEESRTRYAASLLNKNNAISMREVEGANLVIVVGANLLEEAPMMALAIRQAFRKGAKILVIDKKKPHMPFPFDFIEAPNEQWIVKLKEIFHPLKDKGKDNKFQWKEEFGKRVIVCDIASCSKDILKLAAQSSQEASEKSANVKLSLILHGPNSFGAALLSQSEGAWDSMVKAIESGKIKTLVALEAEIPADYDFQEALNRLDFIAIADHRSQLVSKRDHLVIPTTTYAEMNGTYINQEGRAQRFLKVMNPGLRIRDLDPNLHPPREFRMKAPSSDIIPTEYLLKKILNRLGKGEEDPFVGEWEILKNLDPESTGMVILK